MYPKSEYRNLSPHYSTNSATPPYISTYGTLNTRLLIDKTKKKNNISLKIFKTLFFKIYNPPPTKSTFHTKRSFKIPPTTNLNTTLIHLSHVLPYSHLKQKPPLSTSSDFQNFILHHKSFNNTF